MTTAEAGLRLFVAIDLPSSWLDALAVAQKDLQRAIKGAGAPDIRWVRPEGFHLTLKFLGHVEAARRAEVEDALARVPREVFGFEIRLGAPGAFGDRRGPRVLWVGLAGDLQRLSNLAGAVEACTRPLGFEPEKRPFAPHLTLARVPDTYAAGPRLALSKYVKGLRLPAVEPMRVERFQLMQSHLGRGGARYESLATFPL